GFTCLIHHSAFGSNSCYFKIKFYLLGEFACIHAIRVNRTELRKGKRGAKGTRSAAPILSSKIEEQFRRLTANYS
ncbi:hypothetical protein DVA76_18915, partial [Acinetobacter baumannii]